MVVSGAAFRQSSIREVVHKSWQSKFDYLTNFMFTAIGQSIFSLHETYFEDFDVLVIAEMKRIIN